ncbi:hypothetical protein [Sphingomonas sp. NFX23]|uniref:hypothetical protein n=1 Tax=Sphingomonas sp. NFX23 TaxID=2819532 RepID=UPI003CEE1832
MIAPMIESQQFSIAPFGLDGSLEGRAVWNVADLSPKWIGVCSDLIRENGTTFDKSLGGNLNHLSIKFVSANAAALVTISIHNRPVLLGAFASGKEPQSDVEVLTMFAESTSQATLRFHAPDSEAFSELYAITDRPLLVVVPWPDPLVSDQEHDLAREIILHFIGAFVLHI